MHALGSHAGPYGIKGPDDIVDAALFFLSAASRHVTGELLSVGAGMHLNR